MTAPLPRVTDLTFLRDRAVLRRIALVVGAFLVAGVAWWMLAPRWYRSSFTVVPSTPPRTSGIAALLGGDLGGLAAGLGAGLGSPDVARIGAVLQSAAVSDAVIEKFDLVRRYGASDVEAAREALWRHCEVKPLPKPSLVQVSCEDRDPRFAQELLRYFADFGNQVFRRVSAGSASEEVRYLERRVTELRQQAEASAAAVRQFQEKHGIVELDAQARAVVSAMAALNAQRITKQMELGYAQTFAAQDEASSRQLRNQLSVVEDALRDMETDGMPEPAGARSGVAGRKAGPFPPAGSVPRLRAEYEGLYRDRKVAEATLVFALDRLEAARATEARDVSTFQVLDPPTLPTRRSRPRGAETLAVAALLGLAVGLVMETWRARRQRTGP